MNAVAGEVVMGSKNDKIIGMDRDISRRDFLNGVNIVVAGSLMATPLSESLAADGTAQMIPGYYPPTRDGLRGSHPGSFELAHLLRDGEKFSDPDSIKDTGEKYDLVVVGGGISGLAAAHFYRKEAGQDVRILILDNHDDFGGHAKRNEFNYKDQLIVDLGGTEYIEAPWRYPEPAKILLDDLGIDVSQAETVFDHNLYPSQGMQCGIFFDKATFGEDTLVAGDPSLSLSENQVAYVTIPAELDEATGNREEVTAFFARSPLSQGAQAELISLFCDNKDYLERHSPAEKLEIIKSTPYLEYLRKFVGASEEVIKFLWMWRGSYMGSGTDLSPALSAFEYGLPGGSGLGVEEQREWYAEREGHTYKEDFHFPDGNASLARMLVRHMIPNVAPGSSMHDIISAKFDYTKLDRDGAPVRIRLNSTVLNVAHKGSAQSVEQVEITYARSDATLNRVRAKHCIMACYNAVIPHICPELPYEQRDALHKMIRTPLVSVSVLIDNWQAFKNLGIFAAYCPGSFFSDIRLSYPLKFDDYQSSRTPDEPITVHMYHIPVSGEGTASVQFRAGRWELLDTPFEVFEENIRTQLGAMLGSGGFDPARDIKGIIVNRWPHGYAMGYDHDTDTISWFSDRWTEEQMHWIKGRKKHGSIAIANSDAGAQAMTEAAVEQGHRAVQDLLKG